MTLLPAETACRGNNVMIDGGGRTRAGDGVELRVAVGEGRWG
ncbi:hypothetical protein JOD64_005140 [Micromonospora luteifusca]|uniref:Uncharacterized protein n=1 Tax=Micromonospora luteifusca TaxID=709860 RepID=A0ABS2M0E0_9ACTN|nr:hypothetical protein [Micromonospora luteifusca]MBM7493918.1 hypothetical protein [Micromonospora luteifusca]